MIISFFNKKIDLRFVSHKTLKKHWPERELYGYYYEDTDGKCMIRIDKDLPRDKKLEILIHELTHAARLSLSEEFVQKFGEEISRVIREFWNEL